MDNSILTDPWDAHKFSSERNFWLSVYREYDTIALIGEDKYKAKLKYEYSSECKKNARLDALKTVMQERGLEFSTIGA